MGAETRRVAALVLVQILTVYLTFPVDMLVAGNLAAGLDAWQIPFTARPVLIEQQLRGSCLTNSLEHLSEGVAAREEQQQYGDIGLSGMFHFWCKDTIFWHGLHRFTRNFYIFAAK